MSITAHVMVKNEYKFVWYSVMSVINHVDRLLLWDTGSTDGTIDVVKEILNSPQAKNKISFKNVSQQSFSEERTRQEMLDETNTSWFLVVDGDEIWWESSIKMLIDEIKENGHRYESIVVPTVNTVGDIFHYQELRAGNYHLAGRIGHYNLRAVNKSIPGLKSEGYHGIWGWADINGKQIQERDVDKIKYINAPYLHCTFLDRARVKNHDSQVIKRSQKRKHEIGISFPLDFYYPEVLFRQRPQIVQSVWSQMSTSFKYRSALETPIRKIKRRVLTPKVGY